MTQRRSLLETVVDTALEVPVAPSFTRIGHDVRSRVAGWANVADIDLGGRVVAITGATSGLGLSAARTLAACGAQVVLLGRDADRLASARLSVVAAAPSSSPDTVVVDMADLDAVRQACDRLRALHDRLDVLVHNAGALSASRTESPQGIETTIAAQVVGPFLMTTLLLDRLVASAPSRVITMSSGGMYTSGLRVDDLQMRDGYRGAEQYARAKRAQVTLNEMWADRHGASGIHFHALHPGWADTPGVATSLPTFRRVVGPALRTPDQGADTLVWLAAAEDALASNGGFWHDRRRRSLHILPTTRRSDTPERRQALWEWCTRAAGL